MRMELKDFIKLLNCNKKTVFWSVLVFLMIGALLTLVQPLEYGAKSRLLIVQETGPAFDPYAMAKSNENIGNILTKVIASNSFFNETLEAGYNVNKEYFTHDVKKQMKRWKKAVEVKSLGDVGIIEIEVYHRDKGQAEQIAQAINYTLKSKSNQYLNTGEKLTIKIIDQPIISTWPLRPNIPLNLLLALAMGFVYGLSYIYLFLAPRVEEATAKFVSDEEDADEPGVAEVEKNDLSRSAEPERAAALASQNVPPAVADKVPAAVAYGVEAETAFEDILGQGNIRNILS